MVFLLKVIIFYANFELKIYSFIILLFFFFADAAGGIIMFEKEFETKGNKI